MGESVLQVIPEHLSMTHPRIGDPRGYGPFGGRFDCLLLLAALPLRNGRASLALRAGHVRTGLPTQTGNHRRSQHTHTNLRSARTLVHCRRRAHPPAHH